MRTPWLAIEESFGQGPGLGDLLPYGAYDPRSRTERTDDAAKGGGLFINVDGSLGFGLELEPHGAEAETEEERLSLADRIAAIVRDLPPGTAGQWIVRSWGDVDERLNRYRHEGVRGKEEVLCNSGAGALVASWTDSLGERYREGREGFFPGSEFRSRIIRTFLFVKAPLERPGGIRGLVWYFKGRQAVEEKLAQTYQRTALKVERIRSRVQSALVNCGIDARPVGVRDVLGLVYDLVSPDESYRCPLPDADTILADSRLLRDQLALEDLSLAGTGDGLETPTRKIQCFSMMSLPSHVSPGQPEARAYGFAESIVRGLTGDYLLTVNFTVEERETALRRLSLKRTLAMTHAAGVLGHGNLQAQSVGSELQSCIAEIYSQGVGTVRLACHLTTATPKEKVDDLEDDVRSVFGQCRKETIAAIPAIISSLPLGFEPRMDGVLKRLRTVMSDRFVCFLPLWRSWRGVESPAVLCVNRLGEPSYLDVHRTGRSPQSLVLAPTGSGKSFFMLFLLSQVVRLKPSPFIHVIDIGGSYKALCNALGGRYIELSPARPVCINPLSGRYDPSSDEFRDRMSFWVPLLFLMMRDPAEKRAATREESVLLEQVLGKTFQRVRDRDVTLSDCAKVLRESGEMGLRMATNLHPFLKEGRFGRLFDGPSELAAAGESVEGPIEERLTVFDVTACKDTPELMNAVMAGIFNEVTRYVGSPALRTVRKYLVIEEAWALLKDPVFANWIMEGYKTMRKLNGAAFLITQDVGDLAKTESGRAIISNASNVFLLRHGPSALAALRDTLNLSEGEVALASSLEFRKPFFNEFLYLTEHDSRRCAGVFRAIADPVRRWTFTTEPAEFALLEERLRDAEGDLVKALTTLGAEYPFGLAGPRAAASEVGHGR